MVHHLEGMREYATELPAVNQTELTPFNQVSSGVPPGCQSSKPHLDCRGEVTD